MNCPYCDNTLPPQASQCPHCGAAVSQQTAVGYATPQPKSEAVALLLSLLLCGGGQMYNGQVAKGIVMLIVCFFLWLIGIGFIVNIISCIDAYKIAKKINSGKKIGDWEWF